MSQLMKDTLLKGNAEIAKGNHEGFLELCTEETEWTFLGDQVLKGKEAVRSFMNETYLEPPEVIVDSLISEGDSLVATGKITIKDKSGNSTTQSYCDVWQFEGDKLARLKAFVV